LTYYCPNHVQDAAIHAFDFLFDFERNDEDLRRPSAKIQD